MTDKEILEEIIKNEGHCKKVEGLECYNCPVYSRCNLMSPPFKIKEYAIRILETIESKN